MMPVWIAERHAWWSRERSDGSTRALLKIVASRSQLELAVLEYVAWFNDERLHESLGDRPPREIDDLYAAKDRLTTPIRRR